MSKIEWDSSQDLIEEGALVARVVMNRLEAVDDIVLLEEGKLLKDLVTAAAEKRRLEDPSGHPLNEEPLVQAQAEAMKFSGFLTGALLVQLGLGAKRSGPPLVEAWVSAYENLSATERVLLIDFARFQVLPHADRFQDAPIFKEYIIDQYPSLPHKAQGLLGLPLAIFYLYHGQIFDPAKQEWWDQRDLIMPCLNEMAMQFKLKQRTTLRQLFDGPSWWASLGGSRELGEE